MISRERALALVGDLLARDLPTWRWAGPPPTPDLYHVEERAVGWLVFWRSAEQARGDGPRGSFVGGHYLVDRYDGSLHFVPAVQSGDEDWEEQYLVQVRGVRPPDPLAASVRELARNRGVVAAMGHLRRRAPRLGPHEAKAYVTAVRDGAEPPEELAARTRPEGHRPLPPVETVAGPAGPADPEGAAGRPGAEE
ncbi:YrhB domain-containing protein [Streptomyces filamentosus]|uniref:YrhB domain-containing protein n=1 Tax=Streptomyces filamentosus TaxID=67294 RepID=UPI0033D887E0